MVIKGNLIKYNDAETGKHVDHTVIKGIMEGK